MPCYRCGTRQTDPDRGASPWRRGVQRDRQVLICPGCQVSFDWSADLDRCAVCNSLHLVRRLGEVECRDCGWVGERAEAGEGSAVGLEDGADGADVGDLAAEVERALSRVLGTGR